MFEEAAPGANGAVAAADRGRALLHDPRIARLGFALQFVIQVCIQGLLDHLRAHVGTVPLALGCAAA